MSPKTILILFSLFSLLLPVKVQADYTQKLEQQINLIDQVYSTNSLTAAPTDNSLGLVFYDADKYNDQTVYFEALIRCDSCTGGNQTAIAGLYNDEGTLVTNATVATTSASFSLIRSANITSTITDNDEYSVRLRLDAASGTAYLQAARLVIVQSASNITHTQTQIEIGNLTQTASTDYVVISGPKIYLYDADSYSDITGIYFEANLKTSTPTGTASAALSTSNTCSSVVSGSELTVTGDSFDRLISSDITSSLTDGDILWVCFRAAQANTAYLNSGKVIIDQVDANGINKIQLQHLLNNTTIIDNDDSYTASSYLLNFNPDNFLADLVRIYYQPTLLSGGGTAYSRLFNITLGSTLSGSELSTNNSGYTRLISSDLGSIFPTTSSLLDTHIRNSATNLTSQSSSSLIIELERILDPSLTFNLDSVEAASVHNGITTSVSTTYDTLPFGHLTSGTPKYAAHHLYASTNAPYGYQVTVKMLDFLQGLYPANNIDPFTASWDTPQTWSHPDGDSPNTNTGWIGANTTDTRVSGWSDAAGKFGALSSSDNLVMYSTGVDSGTDTYVTYALEVNIFQPADEYQGTLTYQFLPRY